MTRTGSSASRSFDVRCARYEDIPILQAVEGAAAERFRAVGMTWVADAGATPAAILIRHIRAGTALIVVAPMGDVAGFSLHEMVGNSCYLAEICVAPAFAGNRLGRLLIDRVAEAGASSGAVRLILRTFADVPWNAPYYERLGFRRMPLAAEARMPLAHPRFRRIVAGEIGAGMNPSHRLFMERPVGSRSLV